MKARSPTTTTITTTIPPSSILRLRCMPIATRLFVHVFLRQFLETTYVVRDRFRRSISWEGSNTTQRLLTQHQNGTVVDHHHQQPPASPPPADCV